MWPIVLMRRGCEGEREEYDNLAVYNEALLATMDDSIKQSTEG